MNDKEFKMGLYCSLVYIVAMILVAVGWGNLTNNYSLSKGGDFLSGMMSPLTIIWLILVYRQQQKEMFKLIESQDNLGKLKKEEIKLRKEELLVKTSGYTPAIIIGERYEPEMKQHGRNFRVTLIVELVNTGKFIKKIQLGAKTSCRERPRLEWPSGASETFDLICVDNVKNNQVSFNIILLDSIDRYWNLEIGLSFVTAPQSNRTTFQKPYIRQLILSADHNGGSK